MSKPEIREVKLEIVRPGKQHNQLLSPLTPYMALCGEGSPITFHVEFEHQQFLNRLERLRYMTEAEQKYSAVPNRMREAEVGDLGNEIARILSRIETLSTELARAQAGNRTPGAADSIVHLRLVASGSELSLIPFEIAIAPLAYPGEGLEFCLQASLPIVVTREIRRGSQMPITWNRSSSTAPKVLVIYAEPEGMKVPAQAHIQVVRAALEPWIRHVPQKELGSDAENDQKRLRFVKDRLRVLPNASIESIYEACAKEKFTHIHILAHGDVYEQAGDNRYGVALCRKDSTVKEVVGGKRLAKALQAEDRRGTGRSDPVIVSLATCDSGNQASVLVPGGSIAHDLHVEGIPWVFASQFPLTVNGSVRMAEILYQRLFRGDDPRQVLFELRRQLYQNAQKDHDWASVVAYAVLPRDFPTQMTEFRSRQIKQAINVCLDRADSIAAVSNGDRGRKLQTVDGVIDEVEEWLSTWKASEPTGDRPEERLSRADIRAIHGSTYKRLALLLAKLGGDRDDVKEKVQAYYRKSIENYRSAMIAAGATGMMYYWSATQYLSLQAVKNLGRDAKTYELASGLATRDTELSASDSIKAWAYATLAELAVLRTYHSSGSWTLEEAIDEVARHCSAIVQLMGPRSFHVGATVRQFKRYLEWADIGWGGVVQKALNILAPPGSPEEYDYPDGE